MNSNDPLVSIVMPVYNASKYLDEAIVSILIQSYSNFELLAINDGSTDNSIEILERYAKNDKRIKIISQKNEGVVSVLNKGIVVARGDLIARMDADDISFPNRLSDQVKAFRRHPDTALVCGNFEVIDEQGQFLYRELLPPLNEDIQQALFVRNPIAHGSVMFKKDIISVVGNYSDNYGPTEDLELWMRISQKGLIRGTGTPLYKWRVNSQGITMTNNKESRTRGKEHNEKRWETSIPSRIKRRDILDKNSYYLGHYPDFGHFYKIAYLDDRAIIATRLIKKGSPLRGVQELIIIASTGRTGLGIVLKRVSLLLTIYVKNIFRFKENNTEN